RPGLVDETRTRAKKHYREAARLSPDDPAPLFEIYWMERDAGDPDRLSEEGWKALQGTLVRSPDNLPCVLHALWHSMSRKDPERALLVQHALRLLPGDVDSLFQNVHPRQNIEKIGKLLAQKPDEV